VDVHVQQHAVARYVVTQLFFETRFCDGDIDLLLKKCKSQKFCSAQNKSVLNIGICFTLYVRLFSQTDNKLQLMICVNTYMPMGAIKRAALMFRIRKGPRSNLARRRLISIKVFRGVPSFLQEKHGIMPQIWSRSLQFKSLPVQ
jgi:hypothetical protein